MAQKPTDTQEALRGMQLGLEVVTFGGFLQGRVPSASGLHFSAVIARLSERCRLQLRLLRELRCQAPKP